MTNRHFLSPLLLRRCGFCIAIAGVVGIACVLSKLHPSGEWQAFFPKCMFFQTTGLHCPGCGCTRAVHHLLNGQFLLALQHNAMLVIALPWIILEVARGALWFLELPVPGFMQRRIRLKPWQAITIGVAVFAFWILRNLPYAPFDWLAPPSRK